MEKLFSFVSWNVEHFAGKAERVQRVVDLLQAIDPDVFALFEVKSGSVYGQLMDKMPEHAFSITENTTNPLATETLIGVRRSIQHFVTQREEFKSQVPSLRPGAMATLRLGDEDYCLLFLHVKSFADPRAWGLRDDMFKHSASLKRTLDRNRDEKANFLVLGDLNSMGLDAPYNDISDIDGTQELSFLCKRMSSVDMKMLKKSHEQSWWNGKSHWQPSALDHVFASEHLQFADFDGAQVRVIGWPEKGSEAERIQWIDDYSDHAILYGELIKSLEVEDSD